MTGIEAPLQLFVVGFVVTIAMLFVLRPLAKEIGLVDTPGGRKIHTGDIPIIGGVAIYIGVFFSAMIGPILTRNAVVILSMGGLMAMVGIVDDRFDLKPSVRLLSHLAAALVLVLGTGYTVEGFGRIIGFVDIGLGYVSVPFTIVACVALVNACNMLDGMDGLAGGTSIVAFAALATVTATSVSVPPIISASMVGAIAAFLVVNVPAKFNRSFRTFMGDAGSTLLGFTLAAVSLILIQPEKADMPPTYVLWFVAIPIFELFTTTFRRLWRGQSPLFADNGHFHHTLLEAGFSVRLIFGIYVLVSVLCAGLGLVAYFQHTPEWQLFLGFLALYAAWLLFIRTSPAIGTRLPAKLRRDIDSLHI